MCIADDDLLVTAVCTFVSGAVQTGEIAPEIAGNAVAEARMFSPLQSPPECDMITYQIAA